VSEQTRKTTELKLARIETLETRTLYSADIISAALDPASDIEIADQNDSVQHWLANADSDVADEQGLQHQRLEIVFIDQSTPDFQLLVQDLTSNSSKTSHYEVVVISSSEDGLALITETLANYRDVDAVHLVSHGSDGNVNLGDAVLNHESFAQNQQEIATWAEAFSVGGDLLIYGCDFAATKNGVELGEKIAAVVGVDIASSDDATGGIEGKSDWNLEQVVGSIETTVPFSEELQGIYQRTLANTITVDTTADVMDAAAVDLISFGTLTASPGADGTVSLREAIVAANLQPGADTINVPAGTYNLTLASGNFNNGDFEGDLDITSGITILGADSATTIINAGALGDRVIEVHASGDLTIEDVTLEDGTDKEGAGIRNEGNLNASHVVLQNNSSSNLKGGGLYNLATGVATLEYTEITSNAANGGGGVYNEGDLGIYFSNIGGNSTLSSDGGGVKADNGNVEIKNTTIYTNFANTGAGLSVAGATVLLENSTVSGNVASFAGGGIYALSGSLLINHSTIADNQGGSSGAGIASDANTTSISNSIVADNIRTATWGATDIDGASSGDYNLVKATDSINFTPGPNDQIGVDPQLASLGLNGGTTYTHAITATSAAVGAADPASTITSDQQTLARDASPDAGAFEYIPVNSPPVLNLSAVTNSYTENTPLIIDNAMSITDADNVDFDGGVFTVTNVGTSEITDRVYIQPGAAGLPIDVVGSSVQYQGIAIGTWSGGVGSTPLQIQLNSLADQTAVTALGQRIAFTNDSENPSNQFRTLTFSVTDGDGGTSSIENIDIFVTPLNDPPVIDVPATDVFINEIHYDNVGADTNEGVEVAAVAGTDLNGWTLSLYSQGNVYDTVSLTGIVADEGNGLGAIFFPVTLVQNGPADGIALADSSGSLIEFLSYEGTTLALSGPAAGVVSQDIGVAESSATPVGYSIQRVDPGTGFTWALEPTSTYGALNNAQASAANNTHIINEDTDLVFSAANNNPIVISDPDTSNNLSVTLSVAQGVMSLASSPATLNQTHTITGSLTQINTELDGLRYIPSSNDNGTVSLNITVDDQDASGGGNQTSSATIDIVILPVNDAPVLDTAAPLQLPPQSEDDTAPTGTSVAAIISSILPTDVVTDVDTGAVEGIAVVGADTLNGVWQYSISAGSWLTVPSVSDASALLLDLSAQLRFIPNPDFNGTATVDIRAWDQADGLTSGSLGVDVSNNGGNEAYSSAINQAVVTINSVPDAPVLTLDQNNSAGASVSDDYVTSFTVGGGSVLIADTDSLITDIDSLFISELSVTITNPLDGGQEVLQADISGYFGFTKVYDSSTSVLTIGVIGGGNKPVSDFNGVLNTVSYENNSTTPDTTSRVIEVVVKDPDDLTDTAQTTISILPDSTAPAVDINTGVAVFEGSQITIGNTSLSSSDDVQPDSSVAYNIVGPTSGIIANTGAPTVAITSFTQDMIDAGQIIYVHSGNEQTSDQFSFTVDDSVGNSGSSEIFNITIKPVNDAPVVNVPGPQTVHEDGQLLFGVNNGNAITTSDADAASLQVTLSVGNGKLHLPGTTVGSTIVIPATIANIDTVLDGVFYTPDDDYNGSDLLTVTVDDMGQTGSGGAKSTVEQIPITVTPVNDAPTGTNNTLALIEDQPSITIADTDFGYSDIEGHTFTEVVITTVPVNGTLKLAGNPVTSADVIPVTAIQAGQLVFEPDSDLNGTGLPVFDFAVRDDGGTANTGINTDQSSNTISLDITSVNDPPQGADKTIPIVEDTPYVLAGADFGFSDPVDTDFFAAVTVTQLPAGGSLTLGGTSVTTNQMISITDINNGDLVYTPGPDDTGVSYSDLRFLVHDNGGTSNGGLDVSQAFNTLTFDVSNINDAPAGADKTIVLSEDSNYTLQSTDFGFTDINDVPGNFFAAITVTQLPVNGTLTLAGNTVSANQLVSITAINNGDLLFTPAVDANGIGYSNFQFLVHDNGGIGSGGQDIAQTANTLTFDVTAINDAPFATDSTVTVLESSSYVIQSADFGYTDVDDFPAANIFTDVTISQLPPNGTLTLAGVAVTTNQMISVADIDNGDLLFTPPPNANGVAYSNIRFFVHDDGGTGSGGLDKSASPNTLTFDVSGINNAPTGSDNTVSLQEDSSYVIAGTDFGFTDVNDTADNFAAVTVTQLPPNGTLTLAGSAVSANQLISITAINNNDLVFTPAPDANGSGYSSFEFLVHDDGGTAYGGQDIAQAANTLTFDVTNVNDAPLGADNTISLFEDSSYVLLSTDFGFTDPDETSVSDNFAAVTITQLPANGTLTLSGSAVTANQLISITAINNGDLVFAPAPNANGTGYSNFEFLVHDDGGVASGGLDISQAANRLTFDVVNVNDAPSGADNTITLSEDGSYILQGNDFGFTDNNDNSGAFASVIIVQTPVSGVLALAGNAVAANQVVSVTDINNGDLIFTPASNATGSAYSNFRFLVSDNGGTANGGIDTAQLTNTITFDVENVNDAPFGADNTISLMEDDTYVLTGADFGYSDPDDNASANNFAAVTITQLPASGTLSLGGVAINTNQMISITDINNADLLFTPAANGNGSAYSTVQFLVHDDGGIFNGGRDISLINNTITFDVTAVNDPPVGSNSNVQLLQNTSVSLSLVDFGFNDTENHPLHSVIIDTLPTNGTLLLNTIAVAIGDVILSTDINAGNVSYQPYSNTALPDFVDFTVRDTGGTANGGNDTALVPGRINLSILPVNTAPAGADSVVAINEDSSHTFSSADFGFSDPVDTDAFEQVIVSAINGAGTFTLNGNVITLPANIPVADINAGGFVFTPTANANGGGYATIEFKVRDDGGVANGGNNTSQSDNTITIDVAGVNDAPVSNDSTVTVDEDQLYTFSIAEFGFSDPIDQDAFAEVVVDSVQGNGTLLFNGVQVAGVVSVTAADISSGLLQFLPDTNTFGTNYAAIEYRVKDSGGTANGGIDTAQNSNTLLINVDEVNDAPIGANTVIQGLEDTPRILGIADFGFTDVDNHQLQSVVISTLPVNGSLMASGVAVSPNDVISVSTLASNNLIYQPNLNSTQPDTLEFIVVDNGGTSNNGFDTAIAPAAIDINILPVNDEPAGQDGTIVIPEDGSYVLSTSDFGFSDAVEQHDFDALMISSSSGNGLLTLNGNAVSLPSMVSVSDIDAGQLVFAPAANDFGSNYALIEFQVVDSGGVTSNGVNTDQSPNFLTIDITSVNDAPSGTDSNVTAAEDQTLTLGIPDFGFTDPDNNQFAAVIIDSLPGSGSLKLSGQPVSTGDVINAGAVNLGQLTYTPVTNSTSSSSFDFTVVDSGGMAGGGNDTDPVGNTLFINIVDVNDAPTGADATISLTEDAAYQFIAADFGFADTDADQFQALLIEQPPASGVLSLGGVVVDPGQVISVGDLNNIGLFYHPELNQSGISTLVFRVQDNGGTVLGGIDTSLTSNEIILDVSEVNFAPEGSDTTISIAENENYILRAQDFGFSDPGDNHSFTGITLGVIDSGGTVLLNGQALSSGDTVSVADINAGLLTYQSPLPDSTLKIGFAVQDNGSICPRIT